MLKYNFLSKSQNSKLKTFNKNLHPKVIFLKNPIKQCKKPNYIT